MLEGRAEHLIEIPDSPIPLPIRIVVDNAHRLVPIEELVPDLEGEEDQGVDLEEVFRVMPVMCSKLGEGSSGVRDHQRSPEKDGRSCYILRLQNLRQTAKS